MIIGSESQYAIREIHNEMDNRNSQKFERSNKELECTIKKLNSR